MLLIPAIDLRGGQCVRLLQGRFDAETVYASDPLEVLEKYLALGARQIHVVDLDGARDGSQGNRAANMGDCVMAFWGAPVWDDAHALKPIQAALAMQQALKRMQPVFQAKYQLEVRVGIGINTGRMSVGNMGSKDRVPYTVIGDAVNLASRLESLTKEYGTDIIVGAGTKQAVDNVVFRELDRVRVKGKEVAVAIYEPLGLAGQVEPAVLARTGVFHQALQHYRSQNWEQAMMHLKELQAMAPDTKLYTLFLDRIARLRAGPPGAQWGGAFTFENK